MNSSDSQLNGCNKSELYFDYSSKINDLTIDKVLYIFTGNNKLNLVKSNIFNRIKLLFLKKFLHKTINHNLCKKQDLIIYDDIYPHPVSGFRLEEYTVLLTEIKKSKILLSPKAYPIVNTDVSLHPIHIEEIVSKNL